MKVLTLTLLVLLNLDLVFAQEREFKMDLPVRDPIKQEIESRANIHFNPESFSGLRRTDTEKLAAFKHLYVRIPPPGTIRNVKSAKPEDFDLALEKTAITPESVQEYADFRFHWGPAMSQSGLFLAMQHGFRMTEDKTRRELDGPFFSDWKASVKNFRGWDDGGKIFTNYVGHPLQGALTSRIFINNSGVAKREKFGRNKEYWQSRFKAMAWSAVWSTQFEIGPISEASLGNVGQKLGSRNRSKMTYSDVVLTPTLGTMFAVAEDALDERLLKNWLELKLQNRVLIKVLRSLITPTTSMANILRGRAPWRRDFRRN